MSFLKGGLYPGDMNSLPPILDLSKVSHATMMSGFASSTMCHYWKVDVSRHNTVTYGVYVANL